MRADTHHFTFVFNLQSQATLRSLLVHPCVTAQKWKCLLCRKDPGTRTRAIKCQCDDVLVKPELLPGCNKKGELKVSCRFRDSTNESCMQSPRTGDTAQSLKVLLNAKQQPENDLKNENSGKKRGETAKCSDEQ